MTHTAVDWTALRAQALLGTDRQPVHPPSPVDHPAEAAVLAAALVESTRRRAGRGPGRVAAEVRPAPEEERPVAPERAEQLLGLLLDGQVGGASAGNRLVELWLARCVAAGAVVPHRSIPRLLERARVLDTALVREAVGARGRWLAERHPGWDLAVDDAAGEEPPDGLPQDWPSLPARPRADALLALRPDPSDEDDLEAALADRAKSVRHTAAAQLAKLPGSARARRMQARLAPLVRPPRRLRSLGIELPDPPGAAELADATADPPARASAREWWLAQIIAGAPLDAWPAPPAAVVAALSGTTSLLGALTEAVLAQRQPEWATALVEAGVVDAGLLGLAPAPVAEAALVRAVDGPRAALAIQSVEGPWSRSASLAVLAALARRKPEGLRTVLDPVAVDLALRIDPAVAPEIQRWRERLAPDHRYLAATLGVVLHVLSIRTELEELF